MDTANDELDAVVDLPGGARLELRGSGIHLLHADGRVELAGVIEKPGAVLGFLEVRRVEPPPEITDWFFRIPKLQARRAGIRDAGRL